MVGVQGGPQYIHRLRVTDEYILIYSSVTRNRRIYLYITRYREIVTYICQHYISQLLHRLTEEYKLCSSVIVVCSSVITEEHIPVSCSASKALVSFFLALLHGSLAGACILISRGGLKGPKLQFIDWWSVF
jgi:hypothetical protein